MLVEDAAWEAGLVATRDGFEVELRGVRHDVEVIDPRRKALRLADASGASGVKAAMPGRIVRVLVAKGDPVSKGQPVLVVEAMKMENELKAPRDGVVRTLLVASGDLVETGAVLLELDPLAPRE
ncbi:MAG: acetyl-CoA carboxylase biotin carboxyl carrier protein subunit [Oligoflexia bacterium]|nr:acetyl-CoA carboxylase biotin carboxyl carrier protein subunit [Oligoflexia bacterium]